ncbi:EAL domain-containing protein [Duganella sp. BJB1802]|uniref:putative bifunctional diguanylate cyclase/phosphodiesterase n=1 Tax=Duganella sp. BJB1802 TaxID=2744575 RepID=UPI001594DCEF|nr:EAL domain-containing protein [Duganella sp. BJB1802]NVD73081.1 EAL domain-containing protein [Duganella sp. BJB1802]
MDGLRYLYLTNAAMLVVIGVGLLLVWRRHRGQVHLRDMSGSMLCAALLSAGYLMRDAAPAPYAMLGPVLMLAGAIPNLLLLAVSVSGLAGRRLPRAAAALIALGTAAAVLAPEPAGQLRWWPLWDLAVLAVLGALAARWLWRSHRLERWLGPQLILLGLSQLLLVVYGDAGMAPNLCAAVLLRAGIGILYGLSALEGGLREAGKLAARFQLLTEHSVQGVVVTDGKRILYANPAVRAIYGLPLGQGNFTVIADLPPESFSDEQLLRQHRLLQEGKVDIASWEGRREVAGGRELELRFEAWRVEWDGVGATQILITDDTERNASARALVHQATHDKLTGLPNRTVLIQRLKEYCYLADGSLHCTLVVLNIDRFKLFNQSQGHVTGDHVLKAFAAKLKEALGARAELMRLGGDEFAIVDPDEGNADDIAERLHNACLQAVKVPAGEYFIDASMGMAVFPDNAGNAEALLRAANAAMYQAKRTPGTALAMAEQRFEQMSSKSLDNEQALRKGIRNREIYLDYQPKIDAVSGRLLGFEALARWLRPGVGTVSPVEFIAIAERTGLIPELGGMLLEQACRQIAIWCADQGDCVPVAVNVSPMQLLNRGFLELVERILVDTGIPPRCLTLEITESAAVDNLDDTRLQLQQLSALGIDVAMDDFGTGFSSLSMLRQLPLSGVKIDRGLIDPLPAPDAVAVVKAICQLAAALDLQVVAEGIETLEQAVSARDCGCHALQGFFYARPLTVADAGEWMRREQAEAAAGGALAG